MANNNPIPVKGEGGNSDQYPRVSLEGPPNMPLPSTQPSSSRVHSLFYGNGSSSAVFHPPAAFQLPTTMTTASGALHLPTHHNSSQSYSESNLLNSYLQSHHQQQGRSEHQENQDLCPAVELFSTKASDVNVFTVSGGPSFIEQRNSQLMSTSSKNHSNIANETIPPGQYFQTNPNSNNNSLFMKSSVLSQESFSILNTTTTSAVTSQSNLQCLMQNSDLSSSGKHLPNIRQIMKNTSTEYNDSMASSRKVCSSSVSNPSGSSICFVNNVTNNSTTSQFADQSIGDGKSTQGIEMNSTRFVAGLNGHQLLSSLPSTSKIEATSASKRQHFAPIATSSMPISRSTSASVSAHSISHGQNDLPIIMSSMDCNSRSINSNSNRRNTLDAGHHSKHSLTPLSHSHLSSQKRNALSSNRFPDPFVCPLPVNTTANIPGSSFHIRQGNVDFLPIPAIGTDNDAPQLIPELLLEPNEAHPVFLEEPSASGKPNARIFAPRGMFQTDDECLVSSSTERAVESEFGVESRMGSSSNPSMPLLDSTVDSTGDPTPLECLDSPADVYSASPVESNSSSIDGADADLVSSVRYPRSAIISASSLKDIALASFPPKSLDSDSSDDDNHHIIAASFPSRNHNQYPSSSPRKQYQATSSGCQNPKSNLSPSSATFSAFTNPSSVGPSHGEGLQQKHLPIGNEEEEPEHMDDDSSSQDSVEGVASCLELGLASAGHGLGCSDSVARSTPLLPPAQILERETPSPPLSPSHNDAGYQHDLQEYGSCLPSIDTRIETNSESSIVDPGSGTSGFVPLRARLHTSATAPQYQMCSVKDSTQAARTSGRLPMSITYTTIHDYTVAGAPVVCTSSAGNCSSASFPTASVDYATPNIRKTSKLGPMPTETAMFESAHFSTMGINAGSRSVTGRPASNWTDTDEDTSTSTNVKQNGYVNSTTNYSLQSASSLSEKVSPATAHTTCAAVGSSSETSPKTSSARLLYEKMIDTSITLDLGKRNRSMFDGTDTRVSDMHSCLSNEQPVRFNDQGRKSAEILHVSESATCNTASSSAIRETISNAGLFSPIVSLSECFVPSSTCTNRTASSPNVDSYGYMSDTGYLSPNPSYTTASVGDGVTIGGNPHSLFHPPVFRTHTATTIALTSSFKDGSSRSFQIAPIYTHSSTATTLPKKVLVSTVTSLACSTETSGSNESLSNSSIAKSVSTVTPFSDAQCSVRESFFKPIPTPSILNFNKDDCYSKVEPEENAPLISYEVKFDNNGFSSFSNDDYLSIIPSSALSPSVPCATNSRYAIKFEANVPASQSQPINFSSMPTVDASIHTPEVHEASPSKFGSSISATLDLSGASLHSSSSTLSPLTLSFNSSNSLLGNSFEIFPSGHSFTERIASLQSTNTPAVATTTYTVSSSSLKRELVGVSHNSYGPAYAKSKNVTASVSMQVQEIAVPTVDTEGDVSKNADDYYDRSMLDHMRLIGDAYENQDGSSSTNSYSSRIVDHRIEEMTSDDYREQTLMHAGKRHLPAGVSATERNFDRVSVAMVESQAGGNTNTVSRSNNSLLVREVGLTSFTSSEVIGGASYSVEQHQSHNADHGLPELQHHKPEAERHATRNEVARDQHLDVLPRRHGDKLEMRRLPAQHREAQVKQKEKEHCSRPDGTGPRDRVARRAIKRPRASPQPCSDEVCRECLESGEACTLHEVESITDGQSISDRTILSRAWASLPSQHLSIRRLPASNRDPRQYGVISKRRLDQHTFFGPLVGVAKPDALPSDTLQNVSNSCSLTYKFTNSAGEVMILDTSDTESNNWMSFVGAASTLAQQNCVVIEREDGDLYFYTTRSIPPAAQLRVGYSKQYAAKYGFQSLQATPQEIQVFTRAAAEERDSWPCYECDARLTSSADLQQHLSTHEGNEPPKRKSRTRSRLTLKRRRKAEARQGSKACKKTRAPEHSNVRSSPLRGPAEGAPALLSCLVCDKTFTNSKVLALHQLLHGRPVSGVQQQLAEALSCPQCFQVHASREQLLAHVESHVVPPNELNHRREGPPASIASSVGGGTELPLDSPALGAPGTALSDDASVEVGSEQALVTKLYDCPICREEMLSLQQLRAHLPHHVDERGRYHCPTCGRDFDLYRKVRRHIRAYCFNVLHCTECNRPFPSAVKLKMHMLTHSDRRDFKCDLCESSFKRKDKLRDHQKRVHGPNNTRPSRPIISLPSVAMKKEKAQVSDAEAYRYRNSAYQCRLCLLGFKRRGMLVNHTLKRHPEVALSGVPDLNKPLQSSTMEYHCPHCSKVYRSNIRRNLHMSKGHPGKQPLPPNALVTKPSPTLSSDAGGEGGLALTDPPRYAVRCKWCHREYLTQAKLNQHHRKYHRDKLLPHDKQPTHLQQQEQMQSEAVNVIEVASGPSPFEEIKQNKSWNQSSISYYVDNNNVTRQLELSGKVNGAMRTEHVVYESDHCDGGVDNRNATDAVSNDNITGKFHKTKCLGTGDLLTQAMGVICLDLNNATVASASASNVNTLVNGRIVHTEEDGQTHKHHSPESTAGHIILSDGEGTLNNGVILGHPLPSNQNVSAPTPVPSMIRECDQQQNFLNAKASSGELVTWTLLSPDSGNTYTIALPPGQLIQLAPNVVATSNTSFVVNEGVAYSTLVPVSR